MTTFAPIPGLKYTDKDDESWVGLPDEAMGFTEDSEDRPIVHQTSTWRFFTPYTVVDGQQLRDREGDTWTTKDNKAYLDNPSWLHDIDTLERDYGPLTVVASTDNTTTEKEDIMPQTFIPGRQYTDSDGDTWTAKTEDTLTMGTSGLYEYQRDQFEHYGPFTLVGEEPVEERELTISTGLSRDITLLKLRNGELHITVKDTMLGDHIPSLLPKESTDKLLAFLAPAPTPEPVEIQPVLSKGDAAEVTGDAAEMDHGFDTGTVVEILSEKDSDDDYLVRPLDGGTAMYVRDIDLKPTHGPVGTACVVRTPSGQFLNEDGNAGPLITAKRHASWSEAAQVARDAEDRVSKLGLTSSAWYEVKTVTVESKVSLA